MKRWMWLVVVVCLLPLGVAVAAIPDGGGVIHACYANGGGAVRVVDTSGQNASCDPAGETALAWNQTGPTGPAGPAGPAGDPGGGATVYERWWAPSRIISAAGLDYSDFSQSSLELPAGDYLVTTRAFRRSGTTTLYGCRLKRGVGSPQPVDLYHGDFLDGTIDAQRSQLAGASVPEELSGTLHLDAPGYVAFQCVPYGLTLGPKGEQIHKRLSLQTGKDDIRVTITAVTVGKIVTSFDPGEPAPVAPPVPETVKAFLGKPLSSKDTAALSSAARGGAKLTRADRARIVLLAAAGVPAVQIAAQTTATPAQVTTTLRTFARKGIRGLRQ